jgi:hypothetical protein
MKTLALAGLLLSFCLTSSRAGPPPQSNRQALGESKCSTGFKECSESLNDFKEAQQFMQLKAAVLADLQRLDESKSAKLKIAPVRAADAHHQKAQNGAVYAATVRPNGKLLTQATSAVEPVSLESGAGR